MEVMSLRSFVKGAAIGMAAAVIVALIPAFAGSAAARTPGIEVPKFNKERWAGAPPRFVAQPSLKGRKLSFAVRYQALAKPRPGALPDRIRLRLDVSLPGVSARQVGVARRHRNRHLMHSERIAPRSLTKAQRLRYSVRLPRRVARSLAASSRADRLGRILVLVEHRKDTYPRQPGWELTHAVTSAPEPKAPRRRSRGGQSRQSTSPPTTYTLSNFTPYEMYVSSSGVLCMNFPSWQGNVSALTGTTTFSNTYAYTGDQGSGGQSTSTQLQQDAIAATQAAATKAANTAIKEGAKTFTEPGAAAVGISFAKTWVFTFLKDVFDNPNDCSNLPGLFLTSAVAQDLLLEITAGSDGNAEPYGTPQQWSDVSGFSTTAPAQSYEELLAALGNGTTQQWHWNGNNPIPSGGGASYWTGGLIQVAETNAIGLYYMDNSEQLYGPVNEVEPSLTATSLSTGGVELSCEIGNWILISPWGDLSGSLDDPVIANADTSNHLIVSWYYNYTASSGQSVPGAPIPDGTSDGVAPTTFGYPSDPSFSASQIVTPEQVTEMETTGTISAYGCSVQAYAQLTAADMPPEWPTTGTSGINQAWNAIPNNATAPPPG